MSTKMSPPIVVPQGTTQKLNLQLTSSKCSSWRKVLKICRKAVEIAVTWATFQTQTQNKKIITEKNVYFLKKIIP